VKISCVSCCLPSAQADVQNCILVGDWSMTVLMMLDEIDGGWRFGPSSVGCPSCLEYLRPRTLILLKTLALYKPLTYLLTYLEGKAAAMRRSLTWCSCVSMSESFCLWSTRAILFLSFKNFSEAFIHCVVNDFIICPTAIACSMGQIIKPVCRCLCVRPRALSLTPHFLINFHLNCHRRKNPKSKH